MEFYGNGVAFEAESGGNVVVGIFVEPKENNGFFDILEPVDQRTQSVKIFALNVVEFRRQVGHGEIEGHGLDFGFRSLMTKTKSFSVVNGGVILLKLVLSC